MQSSDLEFQPQRYSSEFVVSKMIAVEHEEEAKFFPQRVIFRIVSIAAMFYTYKEMHDPPNGRFWTLTPDSDVYPEMLLVPSVSSTGGTNLS